MCISSLLISTFKLSHYSTTRSHEVNGVHVEKSGIKITREKSANVKIH